jgi:hypothetical protein
MPSHADDDHRRRLLVAALGFLQLEPRAREIRTLHAWLSNKPSASSASRTPRLLPKPSFVDRSARPR